MPKMLIVKELGFAHVQSSLVQIETKSGSYGLCDCHLECDDQAVEDFQSENKPEAFQQPYGAAFRRFDDQWEHQMKSLNPDDFSAPFSNMGGDNQDAPPKVAGGWTALSTIGYPGGNPGTLYSTNYDLQPAGSSVYLLGTWTVNLGGQFAMPNTGGLIKIIGQYGEEVAHFGHVSASSGFSNLWRRFGISPPWVGPSIFYGHDYEANPTPPPTQIVVQKHDAVSVKIPDRFINYWISASSRVATNILVPVTYTAKGGKLGVFMPIIMRFLIYKRKRDKIISITAGARK